MDKYRIAAIDIGSSAIRMTICEVVDREINILEELRQPVTLGKDTFHKGRLLRSTIDETIFILKNYKKLCDEYRVENIKTVATTAVREAANVDIFIDNILSALDIEVEILSVTKETEYIYNALKHKANSEVFEKNEYQGIIEIGSGTVEIIIYNKNCIVFSRSLPMGALKIKQIFDNATNVEDNFLNYLKVTVDHELRNLKREIPASKINVLFGIGSELDLLDNILNKDSGRVGIIDKKGLDKICTEMQNYSDDEIVHKLNIPFDYAETFHTITFMFSKIIDFFECDKIYIPRITLRDGIIYNLIDSANDEKYFKQIKLQLKVNSINIGRKLNYDEKHSLKVMKIALKLFEEMRELHHLGNQEKLYLMCASILHDVGATLSNSSHHKHSLYIIKSQEFFYLDEVQKNIVANIARYHRRSIPKKTHPDFMALSRKNRMVVMKLAAILRIADGLDNTHLQLVNDVAVSKIDNISGKLIITASVEGQIFAESYSFKYKKDLFELIYGITVKLKIKRN